jgi:ATP-dependent DNA helicase RecQ
MELAALLQTTFGFSSFRANQEAVCRAAVDGQDVLLVMPTGAGKSLCYQLPTIARGGTALVISPLIALMDDQAAKLTAAGLRVARIHSGLDSAAARQACRDYLDGSLQFLFIAPERLRVPGFPEMLAKRKPALVAIDEAHCISAWGHDFRPDYRTLGQYLPILRPAPIMALTATATPTVQRDIVAQLQLQSPSLFIHGFRRDNLAIEVVEMSKARRAAFTAGLLQDPARRPAIVYAPSRRAADELAAAMGSHFPAAAYHAGLEPSTRERVQRGFSNGSIQVVVATIAFGMGIDKADVRTVVHIALPASVEAYYQEIGRAGRDGLPSRTVLLHDYGDRRMHDFFLERDYPDASELVRVANLLTDDFQEPEPLRARLKMDSEVFERSVEKLLAQGGAVAEISGWVKRSGSNTWRAGYDQQIGFRRQQIDRMMDYVQSPACRMLGLIRHFGDSADARRPCGLCDVCAPLASEAQQMREPSAAEQRVLAAVLRSLDEWDGRSTGKLFTDHGQGDRRAFDALLDSIVRHGWLQLVSDTFVNQEGRAISYRKAVLTHEGRNRGLASLDDLLVADIGSGSAKPSSRQKTTKVPKQSDVVATSIDPEQSKVLEALKLWRRTKAKELGQPAFVVMHDSVLEQIALCHPTSTRELLRIRGIGEEKADRFGSDLLALLHSGSPMVSPPAASETMERPPAKAAIANTRVQRPNDATASTVKKPLQSLAPSLAAAGNIESRYAKERSLPLPKPSSVEAIRDTNERGPEQPSTGFYHRQPRPEAAPTLTTAQQALDQRLRAWRAAESERTGMPPFFVLGSSTLRALVLEPPTTMEHLVSLDGLNADRREKIGPALLELCRAASLQPSPQA